MKEGISIWWLNCQDFHSLQKLLLNSAFQGVWRKSFYFYILFISYFRAVC